MPIHRLGTGSRGLYHYVDGQLRETSGSRMLPDGLRRDRNGGPKKKLVRKPGTGTHIEWESRAGHGSHNDEHRARPPPGQRPRQPPGQPRGPPPAPPQPEQRDETQIRDPEEGQGFDVSEHEGEDADAQSQDAQSQAHSRRTESRAEHSQHHSRHRQGSYGSGRATSTAGVDPFELRKRELDAKIENDQNLNGHPRGYDSPTRATRSRGFDQVEAHDVGPPPWLSFKELMDWQRRNGKKISHGCDRLPGGYNRHR